MGSRANSAIVLVLGAMVVVVEGNDGVEGEVPRWDIAVIEVVVAGDGWKWKIEKSLDWAVRAWKDGEDGGYDVCARLLG